VTDVGLGVRRQQFGETAADFEVEVLLGDPVTCGRRREIGVRALHARFQRAAGEDRLPRDDLEARVAQIRQHRVVAAGRRIQEIPLDCDAEPLVGDGDGEALPSRRDVERGKRKARVGLVGDPKRFFESHRRLRLTRDREPHRSGGGDHPAAPTGPRNGFWHRRPRSYHRPARVPTLDAGGCS
jgi:hypothetical protein